jgi:murein DD-endopeptidase MepM/ murein hydrolase activator NlpD
VLAFGLVLAGGAGPSNAARDKDELERQRAANQEQIDQLRSDLEGTSVALAEAYLSLEAANKELPLAQATLEAAQAEFAGAQQEYEETVQALARAESQKAEVSAQLEEDVELARESRLSLGALARDSLMGRAAGDSELLVLLGASSIDDAARDLMAAEAAARTRTSVITRAQQSAAANKNRQARLESVTAQIAELKDKAEKALAKADAARAAAEEAKAELEELKASMEQLAADLEAKKQADEAAKAQLEEENANVIAELDRLLAEERAKNNLAPPVTGAEPPPTPSGFFGRPLTSIRVSSPFGWRIHPIYGTSRHHDGVDLSAGCGTPIYASAAGTVIFTGWAGGYGNRVVISHGNVGGQLMFSTYNHIVNGGILVSTGNTVSQGQQIANVGTTGASTGCHLHFEIGIGSAAGVVNPMNYIS